jgi:cytochrome P450 family 135
MLPPGPRSVLAQSAQAARDPLHSAHTLRRRYGPIFTRRLLSEPPQVVVGEAGAVRQVFADPTGAMLVGSPRRRLFQPVVGDHSLFTTDGPEWQRHHRLLAPVLQGRAVEGWRDTIADLADQEIARWPSGRPFPLHDGMRRIAMQVILRLVWGARLPASRDQLHVLAPRLLDKLSLPVLVMPPPIRDRLHTATGFTALLRRLDALLHAEITARRRDPGDGDVMSRLLPELTDGEVRDEMVTLLLAGHETTAVGLAWAFERLLRAPDAWERLRDDPSDEDFLQAVVRETLRIRPVALSGQRTLVAPIKIHGYDVPAGWSVLPMIRLVHEDPAVFEDPEVFRPGRFLGEQAGAAMRAWLPFGHGARYCIGARLAMLTLRTVIARVAATTDLAAPDPRPERPRLRQVTVTPSAGATAVACPRHRRSSTTVLS